MNETGVNWPTFASFLIVFGSVCFALGAMRVNNFYHEWLHEHDHNLRRMHQVFGLDYEYVAKGREPGWLHRMDTRITLPPDELEPEPQPEPQPEPETPAPAKEDLTKTGPMPTVQIRSPRPDLNTSPDLRRASAVAPPARLTDDEWRAQQEAEIEAWKAEQVAKWGIS